MESGSRPEPERPAGPQAPDYGGPVPPGGWERPIERPSGWVGQPLASWGSRLAAWIIDGLVVLIPAIVLGILLIGGAVGLTGDDDDVSFWAVVGGVALWGLIMLAIWLVYAPTTMARHGAHNGQTWGKQMVGIRVVRDTGEAMSWGWAALREIVVKGLVISIASSIVPFIPWFLDYFWPLWDDQNRALHDMAVQTHVLKS